MNTKYLRKIKYRGKRFKLYNADIDIYKYIKLFYDGNCNIFINKDLSEKTKRNVIHTAIIDSFKN